MDHFQKYGIFPFCNQLSLHFRNFYYGFNAGTWKSSLPVNRLVIILDSDGKSSFQSAGRQISLLPGTIVLVPAFHEITHIQNSSMKHLSIHFNLEFYCGIDVLSCMKNLWHDDDLPRVIRLRTILDKPDCLHLTVAFQSLCWESILKMLNLESTPMDDLLFAYSRYADLFKYINNHCHAGVVVEQMAEAVRMKKETFTKKFVVDTGVSPKFFFHRILVAHAAKLLSGSDLSIREIAFQLQFCNEFYFSRFFKRHLGLSPQEYRKYYRLAPPQVLKMLNHSDLQGNTVNSE